MVRAKLMAGVAANGQYVDESNGWEEGSPKGCISSQSPKAVVPAASIVSFPAPGPGLAYAAFVHSIPKLQNPEDLKCLAQGPKICGQRFCFNLENNKV